MTPGDLPLWMVLAALFVVGTVVGSFLNVCIYRIPQHERLLDQLRGLVLPPSRCPACGQQIPRRDNIPILGWLALRGRCRFCRRRFSFRYPLIEFLNGLLFALLYWYEVPADLGARLTDSPVFATSFVSPDALSHAQSVLLVHAMYFYHLLLVEALLVATFIDIDRRIIPDAATVPAMLVAVLGAAAVGRLWLVPVWVQSPSMMAALENLFPGLDRLFNSDLSIPAWTAAFPHWHGLAVSLAGLLVGGGSVWIVRIIGFHVLRREAMGFGDVMLMAMIGSFLGWQPVLIVFFLAPLCAIFVVVLRFFFHREQEIPYGPYLSLATLVVLFGWERIWPAAERFFHLGPLVPLMGLFLAGGLYLCLLLTQAVKRLLGIPLYPPQGEWIEQWTPADQLWYFSGEQVDHRQGAWKTDQWPGTAAGRGTLHEHHWRHPPR